MNEDKDQGLPPQNPQPQPGNVITPTQQASVINPQESPVLPEQPFPQAQSAPSPPPAKKHGFRKFLIWTLFLLVLAAGGYGAVDALTDVKLPYEFVKTAKPITAKPVVKKQPQPSSTPAAFQLPEGWMWYENKELGFRIAYPREWGSVKNQSLEPGEDKHYYYEFSKRQKVSISSAPKIDCPQGDGVQTSSSQGWYEKNGKYYVTWCKNSPVCIKDPECGNNKNDYPVEYDNNLVEKINSLTLLRYDFSVPFLDDSSRTYSLAEGLFNLTNNSRYSGLSLLRTWEKQDRIDNHEVMSEFKKILSSFQEL